MVGKGGVGLGIVVRGQGGPHFGLSGQWVGKETIFSRHTCVLVLLLLLASPFGVSCGWQCGGPLTPVLLFIFFSTWTTTIATIIPERRFRRLFSPTTPTFARLGEWGRGCGALPMQRGGGGGGGGGGGRWWHERGMVHLTRSSVGVDPNDAGGGRRRGGGWRGWGCAPAFLCFSGHADMRDDDHGGGGGRGRGRGATPLQWSALRRLLLLPLLTTTTPPHGWGWGGRLMRVEGGLFGPIPVLWVHPRARIVRCCPLHLRPERRRG